MRMPGQYVQNTAMTNAHATPPAAIAGAQRRPARRATNLSLSVDVLAAAKALNINVSQVCDAHLRDVVRREQAQRWQSEHAEFLAAYNAVLAAEELPLSEWRGF